MNNLTLAVLTAVITTPFLVLLWPGPRPEALRRVDRAIGRAMTVRRTRREAMTMSSNGPDRLVEMLTAYEAVENDVARGMHYHWTDEEWIDDGEATRRPARRCWDPRCGPDFSDRLGAVTEHRHGAGWWKESGS